MSQRGGARNSPTWGRTGVGGTSYRRGRGGRTNCRRGRGRGFRGSPGRQWGRRCPWSQGSDEHDVDDTVYFDDQHHQDVDDAVYVAAGKDVEESKSILAWTMKNFPGNRIFILHVHQPASSSRMIPLIGGKFPASRLEEHELKEIQELERKIMCKILDDYLLICRQEGVNAEKLYIEKDDIGKGIVELVYQHSIKKLVMGAAADKHHSLGMMDIESKKAKYVEQCVPSSCQIWFTCNMQLIHMRDTTCLSTEGIPALSSDAVDRTEERESDLELCEVPQLDEDGELLPSDDPAGDSSYELYSQLERAMMETEKFKREAFEESLKRGEAEKTAIRAISRAKALESLYTKELRHRKETEEILLKEKENFQRKKIQWDEEHLSAMDQRRLMNCQIASLNNQINELESEILSTVEQCKMYKEERDELQLQHDHGLKLTEELANRQIEDVLSSCINQSLYVFSLSEIESATCNFDPSIKIGEGGYGSIYKGFLRHTQVAIKVLNPGSMQGPTEFKQEVDVLTKMRHPNVVTLIGACPEAYALVYEYLPNGSLEDRLNCRNNSPPLSWKARIRIAAELCSALIFLHSSTPHSIVHGDLKPGNVLLDANLVCKLSDFGICRALSLQENSSTMYRFTDPKGTFQYLDPHFLATGEISPKSDTYSFGIILLQLLTGKPAFGIAKEVKDVTESGDLTSILDPLAGDWPFVQAKQLVRVALSCCEMDRSHRPHLASEVWRVLEPMRDFCGALSSFHCGSHKDQQPPSYFLCPILQEVMQDPQVAADGFTYELEGVVGWLQSGHDTSPMTNLRLEHLNLTPNYTLRSAIQEWQQQHGAND